MRTVSVCFWLNFHYTLNVYRWLDDYYLYGVVEKLLQNVSLFISSMLKEKRISAYYEILFRWGNEDNLSLLSQSFEPFYTRSTT